MCSRNQIPDLNININKHKQRAAYEKQQNRSIFRTKKKVKVGSGCLVMAAVLMRGLVIAIGFLFGDTFSWSFVGKIFSNSRLVGVTAFAYFGYFAVEADDDLSDYNKSKRIFP